MDSKTLKKEILKLIMFAECIPGYDGIPGDFFIKERMRRGKEGGRKGRREGEEGV